MQKGDVDLSFMLTRDSFARDYSTWQAVLEVLREEEMPLSKATQPIEAERNEMISLIEEEMEERSQDKKRARGAVPMRRLTREEYHYAIEDLTGLRMDLWDILPVDAVGGEGFANQGQIQFTQASDIERYLEAAKGVAARAVMGSGELYFFDDPGQSGQELSAIVRIKKLYRARGFRTGAGEGAEPYGLDQYPKAFYACWLFQHRETLGLKGTTLTEVAQSQGLVPSFVELIHDALHIEDAHPALQSVIDAWQRLPAPPPEGSFSWTQLQPSMEELFGVVVARQKELAKRKGIRRKANWLTLCPCKSSNKSPERHSSLLWSSRRFLIGSLHLDLPHNGRDPELEAMYLKTNQFHVQQLVYLIERMKSLPEGDSTLLDHCMLLFCSNLFDGDRH